jgi:hypothetical protein
MEVVRARNVLVVHCYLYFYDLMDKAVAGCWKLWMALFAVVAAGNDPDKPYPDRTNDEM